MFFFEVLLECVNLLKKQQCLATIFSKKYMTGKLVRQKRHNSVSLRQFSSLFKSVATLQSFVVIWGHPWMVK